MDITSASNSLGLASLTTAADKKTFGAQVVTQTINNLNSDPFSSGGKNADYDFQTKVLSAGYLSKGFTVNKTT